MGQLSRNFWEWSVPGVLAIAAVSGARGQAPSFSFMPVDELVADTRAMAISPNGRYVIGTIDSHFRADNYHHNLWRWDRLTGTQINSGRTFAMKSDGARVAVLDNGLVYGCTPVWGNFHADEVARVFRWNPDINGYVYVPRPSNATMDDVFSRISPDGQYGIGFSALPNGVPSPALFDFTLPVPLRVDLSAGDGVESIRGAGVTLPISGVRYAYAGVVHEGVADGMSWVVASAQPVQVPLQVIQSSPDGRVFLAKSGNSFIVRGDGADWVLDVPPGFAGAVPVAMSQDGRVVVGGTAPFDPQPVVWRRGLPAATLQSVVAGTSAVLPPWDMATLEDVSADGSTVVGWFAHGWTVPMDDGLNPDDHAFSVVIPAANDNCQNARSVTYGTSYATTNGASRAGVSSGVLCASEGTAPDVWFNFVPVATESVSIDTCGSTFDTTLTVFQASNCSGISAPIACNDDAANPCAGNTLASRLSVNVTANTNYYIRVSGYNGAYGSIQVTITAPNRPANDACGQATNVAAGTGASWSNISGVTDARPNCPGTGTPFSDIWFRTVPQESGRMTYSTCNSTINAILTAYDASACGNTNATPLVCGQNNTACGSGVGTGLTVPCVIGQPQLVRLGGLFGATGAGLFYAKFACDQNDLTTYAAQVSSHGPRAFWRFDDSGSLTAADTMRADPYTCGNYPGEYLPGVVRANSYMGKALSLDGTGAYARFDTVPQLHINDTTQCSAATLEAWVRTFDGQAGVVLTSRNNPNEHSLTMVVGYNPIGIPNTDGRVMFIADGPGSLFGAISGVRVDDGNWHHIVGRRSVRSPVLGTYNYELYVDGVYQGNNNLSGGVGSAHMGVNGQYWTVGNGLAWSTAGAAFNGMIDNVALYCGSLSASQIVSHYNTGAPPPCDSIDFNGDGLYPDTADIDDFLSVFSGGPCSTATCHDIDYNNDGLFPDTTDIDDYLRVFSGGAC